MIRDLCRKMLYYIMREKMDPLGVRYSTIKPFFDKMMILTLIRPCKGISKKP
jgi:hypothetical protein